MFDKKETLTRLRRNSKRPIFAIWEGNYLLHRALNTYPSVTTPEGIEVGGVHGLLHVLGSDYRLLRPDYMVVSFDVPGLNFRHRISADYKLADPKDPANAALALQLKVCVRLLRILGVPTLQVQGVESDDVVGSLTTQAAALLGERVNTIVFTGDKDLTQLVDKHTLMCDTKESTGWLGNPDAVHAKFGVEPRQIADYLALCGDKNDGVAGVKGCGSKTAIQLLQEFGSAEAIYQLKAGQHGKKWAKLLTTTALLGLRRDLSLTRVRCDLDLRNHGPFKLHLPNVPHLQQALAALNIRKVPSFVEAQVSRAQLLKAGSLFGDVSPSDTPLVTDDCDSLMGKLWLDSELPAFNPVQAKFLK